MPERQPDPRPQDRSPSPVDAARLRLAGAQETLLAALVAGRPAPEGFDEERLAVQRRALAAKRADVVAKVAPELPEILGADYRRAFLDYAQDRPMHGGYRHDALDFAGHLLSVGLPADPAARRALARWWSDRAGPTPPSSRPLARLTRSLTRLAGVSLGGARVKYGNRSRSER